jgi:hypothetical protein
MRAALLSVLVVLAGPAFAAEATPIGTVEAFWRDVTAAGGYADAAMFDRLFTPLSAARYKRELRERKPEYKDRLKFMLPSEPGILAPVATRETADRVDVELRPPPGVIAETFVFELQRAVDGWRIAAVSSVLTGRLRGTDLSTDGGRP